MPEPDQAAVASAAMVEPIARFCRQSGHMRRAESKARFEAFLPARDGDTSAFKADGQSAAQLEAIAREVVKPPLKGHALVPLATITGQGLQVVDAPEPHPLHVNIRGWKEEKYARRAQAQALADASKLTAYDPA